MKPNIYLILILLTLTNMAEFWHSIAHEHVFCSIHSQVEEANHQNEKKSKNIQFSTTLSDMQPSEEDHDSCNYLGSVKQDFLACFNITSFDLLNEIAFFPTLAFIYNGDPLFHAPKTSPPLFLS